jgi:hypothetical protein
VVVLPVPRQPAFSQSTSTTASLRPDVPSSESLSSPDSLLARQPPPETAHSATPFVADSGVRVVAAVSTERRPASDLVMARPVQSPAQFTSASADTPPEDSPSSSAEPSSTELEVSQAPVHCADALPVPRSSAAGAVRNLAGRASPPACSRSVRDPELVLSHEPPPVSQPDSAPSRSA